MAKVQCMAKVVRAEQLAEHVYSMNLSAPEIAAQAVAGQFISLYCEDRDKLLPRPLSLCEIDRERGELRLVYRVVGDGTREFSRKKADDVIRILGPLGNGFLHMEIPDKEKRAVLVGGGIGIPPLLALAKELPCEVTAVLGYRDADTFLLEEFRRAADRVVVATEDGSAGVRGNVIDAMEKEGIHGDVAYSCGPVPMLRGVKEWGVREGILTWISMEERMACGIGACLACVCKSTETDSHSKVNNKRVCKDGPVFLSTEIEL